MELSAVSQVLAYTSKCHRLQVPNFPRHPACSKMSYDHMRWEQKCREKPIESEWYKLHGSNPTWYSDVPKTCLLCGTRRKKGKPVIFASQDELAKHEIRTHSGAIRCVCSQTFQTVAALRAHCRRTFHSIHKKYTYPRDELTFE